MSEGHEAIIAVALTGDFPSLLEDMDGPEQQLVADELLSHGIGDGKPSFFADIARPFGILNTSNNQNKR